MARPAYSAGQGLRPQSIVLILLSGALQAFTNAQIYANVLLPQSGTVVGVNFNVGAKGGTHSTSTIAVKIGASTVATLNVASAVAGTPQQVEGSSLANTSFAKDAALTLVAAQSGGTSPTASDITVQIDYVPTGD